MGVDGPLVVLALLVLGTDAVMPRTRWTTSCPGSPVGTDAWNGLGSLCGRHQRPKGISLDDPHRRGPSAAPMSQTDRVVSPRCWSSASHRSLGSRSRHRNCPTRPGSQIGLTSRSRPWTPQTGRCPVAGHLVTSVAAASVTEVPTCVDRACTRQRGACHGGFRCMVNARRIIGLPSLDGQVAGARCGGTRPEVRTHGRPAMNTSVPLAASPVGAARLVPVLPGFRSRRALGRGFRATLRHGQQPLDGRGGLAGPRHPRITVLPPHRRSTRRRPAEAPGR